MPPTFVFGDAPEFALASKTLGIAHAPGYPLFSLLSHFFSYFLPVNDYAFKCNLFSSFVSTISLLLFFLLLKKLNIGFASAIFSVIFLGFSEIFFKQALISEVYSLNTLFFLIFLLFYVNYKETKDRRFIYLISFVLGVGLGDHHTLLSLVFIAFLGIFLFEKEWKELPKSLFFFLLGLTVYLYLPLRSVANPVIDFGDPERFNSFYQVITRWQFGFAGRSYSFSSFIDQSNDFALFLNQQFYPLLIICAVFGAYLFYKLNQKIFWIFFLIFLINGILTVYVLNPDENEYFLVHEFLTPSIVIFSVFFSFAIQSVYKKRALGTVLVGLLLFVMVYKYYEQRFQLNQRKNVYAAKLASDSLIALPEGAFIIGESDYTIFPLQYLQNINHLRKDVTVLDADFFMLPWYQKQNVDRLPFLKNLIPDIMSHSKGLGGGSRIDFSALEDFKLNQALLLAKNVKEKFSRDVFFTYDFAEMARVYRPDISAYLVPFGTLFRISTDNQAKFTSPPYDLRDFMRIVNLPPEEIILLTPYLPYLMKEAEQFYSKLDFGNAAIILENIYLIQPSVYNASNLVIVLSEEGKQLKKAEDIINRIISRLTVPDPKVYQAKAVLEIKKGNINEAIKILTSIEERYPQMCEPAFYLFEAYTKAKNSKKSEEYLDKVNLKCHEFYKQRALSYANKLK